MEIYEGTTFALKNSAVTLGKFDGIHLGHRSLLQKILSQGVPTVFTFSYEGGGSQEQIYSQAEKDLILADLGVQREILFPFNETTKSMAPEDFIQKILCQGMDAKYICVGEDFRFGKNRGGDVHLLQDMAETCGYALTVLPKQEAKGDIISSTRIRGLIAGGDIQTANRLLGAPLFFQGEVIHGNAMGRKLSMPTANMRPASGRVLPPAGVYATRVTVEDETYMAVTNLGKKPTVGDDAVGIESYLLDFHKDIYGKNITVTFYDFIRPERKFSDLQALGAQMFKDKDKAAHTLYNLGIR